MAPLPAGLYKYAECAAGGEDVVLYLFGYGKDAPKAGQTLNAGNNKQIVVSKVEHSEDGTWTVIVKDSRSSIESFKKVVSEKIKENKANRLAKKNGTVGHSFPNAEGERNRGWFSSNACAKPETTDEREFRVRNFDSQIPNPVKPSKDVGGAPLLYDSGFGLTKKQKGFMGDNTSYAGPENQNQEGGAPRFAQRELKVEVESVKRAPVVAAPAPPAPKAPSVKEEEVKDFETESLVSSNRPQGDSIYGSPTSRYGAQSAAQFVKRDSGYGSPTAKNREGGGYQLIRRAPVAEKKESDEAIPSKKLDEKKRNQASKPFWSNWFGDCCDNDDASGKADSGRWAPKTAAASTLANASKVENKQSSPTKPSFDNDIPFDYSDNHYNPELSSAQRKQARTYEDTYGADGKRIEQPSIDAMREAREFEPLSPRIAKPSEEGRNQKPLCSTETAGKPIAGSSSKISSVDSNEPDYDFNNYRGSLIFDPAGNRQQPRESATVPVNQRDAQRLTTPGASALREMTKFEPASPVSKETMARFFPPSEDSGLTQPSEDAHSQPLFCCTPEKSEKQQQQQYQPQLAAASSKEDSRQSSQQFAQKSRSMDLSEPDYDYNKYRGSLILDPATRQSGQRENAAAPRESGALRLATPGAGALRESNQFEPASPMNQATLARFGFLTEETKPLAKKAEPAAESDMSMSWSKGRMERINEEEDPFAAFAPVYDFNYNAPRTQFFDPVRDPSKKTKDVTYPCKFDDSYSANSNRFGATKTKNMIESREFEPMTPVDRETLRRFGFKVEDTTVSGPNTAKSSSAKPKTISAFSSVADTNEPDYDFNKNNTNMIFDPTSVGRDSKNVAPGSLSMKDDKNGPTRAQAITRNSNAWTSVTDSTKEDCCTGTDFWSYFGFEKAAPVSEVSASQAGISGTGSELDFQSPSFQRNKPTNEASAPANTEVMMFSGDNAVEKNSKFDEQARLLPLETEAFGHVEVPELYRGNTKANLESFASARFNTTAHHLQKEEEEKKASEEEKDSSDRTIFQTSKTANTGFSKLNSLMSFSS